MGAVPQRRRQQQQQQAGRRRPLVTRTAAAAALFLLGATMEGCTAFLLPSSARQHQQQRLHAAAGEGASSTTTTPIDITAPATTTTAAAAPAEAAPAPVATPYTPGAMGGGAPSSSALATSLDPIGRIDANPQALLDWVKQGRCVRMPEVVGLLVWCVAGLCGADGWGHRRHHKNPAGRRLTHIHKTHTPLQKNAGAWCTRRWG